MFSRPVYMDIRACKNKVNAAIVKAMKKLFIRLHKKTNCIQIKNRL